MFNLNKAQIIIGTATLVIGSIIYFVFRPPDKIYFIYHFGIQTTFYGLSPGFLRPFMGSLPSLFHVFSFILLTAGFLCCTRRGYVIICLGCLSFDIFFEIGQKFKIQFSNLTPDWFEGIPFLENSKNYFLHGTFDVSDLLAIVTGAITAYILLLITERQVAI